MNHLIFLIELFIDILYKCRKFELFFNLNVKPHIYVDLVGVKKDENRCLYYKN